MSHSVSLPKNNVFTVTFHKRRELGPLSRQEGNRLISARLSQDSQLERRWVETLLQGFTDDSHRRYTDSRQYANQAANWSWEHVRPESSHFDVLLSNPQKTEQAVDLILQVFQNEASNQHPTNQLDIMGPLSDELRMKLGSFVLARNFLKELPEKRQGMNPVQYYAFCMQMLQAKISAPETLS